MSASSIIILLALLSVFLFVVNGDEECYAEIDIPHLLMGTKTAYESSRGNATRLPIESACKPVQIWALIRHGARYPDSNVIKQFSQLNGLRDEILLNHNQRGKLCDADLKNLREWKMNPEPNKMPAKELTESGKKEMREFARRLKDSYPELLHVESSQNCTEADYKFRATDIQRTKASMEAFMDGLLEGKKVKPEEPPKKDSLLYTYKNCPAYEDSLISDPIVNSETIKFTNGPDFRAVQQNVSDRLGFESLIDTDAMLFVYEICRFETAWHGRSAWCAAFSSKDINVLEYREDIGCYYYCGPGRRINEMLGCPPLQDMIRRFRNFEKNADEPKAVFYFTHTVTLQATMAAMGIGKDKYPLLSSNYHAAGDRTFKTSLIGPFAGNLVAVFHRCSNNGVTQHKVTLHVSERLWPVSGCADGICDWEIFEQKYADAADQCNLHFCNSPID
ncbi:multiple inositol polyphosphate phosphatase 1 [Nasonia vitripennis]|uniref:Multiple inositol polyphosphate phosphatase 1 n=1 Tax=Nasonia vitripennis TaxID=7425 RepID=A0A7M7IZ42_NASVI|nr:multiple inositol polyphosphate phosphatase 1 [Nasonia vitripennis]